MIPIEGGFLRPFCISMTHQFNFIFDVTALIVVFSIAYASIMWWLIWRFKYPVPIQNLAGIFTIAFLIQMTIYIVFSFMLVDIYIRVYLVRSSIIVICLSQAIPLTVALRMRRDGQ